MFNEIEIARIKHFLSYVEWKDKGAAMSFGLPTTTPVSYIVDQVFYGPAQLTEGGIMNVRKDLQECECIEKQISGARERLQASELGTLKINKNEIEMLYLELNRWVKRLCDDLGVPPNYYSQVGYFGLSGSRNARVQ